jgi:F-type H+-transporting ATPase subunit b
MFKQPAASNPLQAKNPRSAMGGGIHFFLVAIVAGLLFPALAFPQHSATGEKPAAQNQQKAEPHQPAQGQQPGINEEFGQPLAAESAEAAGQHGEGASSQEKMVEELKFSPSVRLLAKYLHVSPIGGYWVGILFDFGILALLIVIALKKNLPSMFRTRTQTIQRGIAEARKASEEANQRLAAIETRLARLDTEIEALRGAAEQEAAAEEKRIQAAAEQDAQRVIEAAEAEIVAATKLARRELKTYAADLAVTLAEKRIHVDAATDQELVRSFVSQLGAAGDDGGGKDRN